MRILFLGGFAWSTFRTATARSSHFTVDNHLPLFARSIVMTSIPCVSRTFGVLDQTGPPISRLDGEGVAWDPAEDGSRSVSDSSSLVIEVLVIDAVSFVSKSLSKLFSVIRFAVLPLGIFWLPSSVIIGQC